MVTDSIRSEDCKKGARLMRYGRAARNSVSNREGTYRYVAAKSLTFAAVSEDTGTRYGGAFKPSLQPYRISLFLWMGTGYDWAPPAQLGWCRG